MKRYLLVLIAVSAAMASGCGKSDAAAAGSSVVVSGSLATTSFMDTLELQASLTPEAYLDRFLAADLSAYSIRCVTLTGTPQAGEGTCSSDGSFSLSIASATDVPLGCFVMKASAIIAVVAFEASTTGIDGNKSRSGSYVAPNGTSGVSFGTVTLDLTKGTATVKEEAIVATGATAAAAGTWADVTGTWTLTCVDGAPTGYNEKCPTGTSGGPPSSIYFHQVSATDDLAKTHTGLAIWNKASDFTSCGSTEGVTLPAGWTPGAGLGGSITLDAMPAAASFTNEFGVCGASTSANCGAITNTSNWGNGTATFSTADCRAMCVAQHLQNNKGVSGTCPSRWSVNWGKPQTITSAGDLACSGNACGTGSGAGYVTRGTKPDARFVVNELKIAGATGSLDDNNFRTEYICINQTSSGCTQVACPMNENVHMTLFQASSTSIVVDVQISTTLSSGAPAGCMTNDNNNWIYSKVTKPERFLMTATK